MVAGEEEQFLAQLKMAGSQQFIMNSDEENL
jgi:hypothetical protein